jgi:energy-converting hydrogenase Eha subunit A
MSALLEGVDPKTVLEFLKYASTFPDYPKNFVPPSLIDPNYVPPTNYIRLEIYTYFMAALMTIVVAARLWIRKRVKGMKFGWDDWLAIPGLVLALGLFAVVILLIRIGGAGRHVYDVSYNRVRKTQQVPAYPLVVGAILTNC